VPKVGAAPLGGLAEDAVVAERVAPDIPMLLKEMLVFGIFIVPPL
jgi:hypothetical protein